ncbi:hypothetical protein DPMN_086984 [Dreissena polymorpha]|uniref:Uncharacterized protein n=1 Tax=Dreissena polymorpha TaxID=45954 RepID=A0A9D4KSW3_DREPO|nr:hypothetical protein DPMN_086984 [Dreissena polymorpha]
MEKRRKLVPIMRVARSEGKEAYIKVDRLFINKQLGGDDDNDDGYGDDDDGYGDDDDGYGDDDDDDNNDDDDYYNDDHDYHDDDDDHHHDDDDHGAYGDHDEYQHPDTIYTVSIDGSNYEADLPVSRLGLITEKTNADTSNRFATMNNHRR